jgi:hypothetical protein
LLAQVAMTVSRALDTAVANRIAQIALSVVAIDVG